MGSFKERWMEQQQEDSDRKLATQLGITLDELNEIEWHWDEDTDNEGNTINHVFIIKRGPDNILKKIKGLGRDNRVIIDINKL